MLVNIKSFAKAISAAVMALYCAMVKVEVDRIRFKRVFGEMPGRKERKRINRIARELLIRHLEQGMTVDQVESAIENHRVKPPLYAVACEEIGCEKCGLLAELYQATPGTRTNRLYWVMTELFVLLHGGADHCKKPAANGIVGWDLGSEDSVQAKPVSFRKGMSDPSLHSTDAEHDARMARTE